jgi:hypothetical protein
MANGIREQLNEAYLRAITRMFDMIYVGYDLDELLELVCHSDYIFLQRLLNGKENQYVQSIG